MRTFALAHKAEAESVHNNASIVALVSNPLHHHFLSIFKREIIYTLQHGKELFHVIRRALLPAFQAGLFIILSRSHKEEMYLVPELRWESAAPFGEPHSLNQLLHWAVNTVLRKYLRLYYGSKFSIVLFHKVLMVKPFALLIVKLGTALAHTA